MWMARLYPTYEPNTCLISNGLSTMAFALPGAVGAKLAAPDRKVLAAVGDGAFLMNSQELETAIREHVPVAVLIWEDDAYGLIGWKMDLELGHHVEVGFSNPDFVAYAESFGARGYRVGAASDLRPMLQEALAADTVSGIDCPVDYTENLASPRPWASSRDRSDDFHICSTADKASWSPTAVPSRSNIAASAQDHEPTFSNLRGERLSRGQASIVELKTGVRDTAHATAALEVPMVLRRGLVELRRTALPLTIATVVLAGTYVALAPTPSARGHVGQPRGHVERCDQR